MAGPAKRERGLLRLVQAFRVQRVSIECRIALLHQQQAQLAAERARIADGFGGDGPLGLAFADMVVRGLRNITLESARLDAALRGEQGRLQAMSRRLRQTEKLAAACGGALRAGQSGALLEAAIDAAPRQFPASMAGQTGE